MPRQHSTAASRKSASRKSKFIPNLVTIHDLTEEERQHVEIFQVGQAKHWRWKDDGYEPKETGYARPLR